MQKKSSFAQFSPLFPLHYTISKLPSKPTMYSNKSPKVEMN